MIPYNIILYDIKLDYIMQQHVIPYYVRSSYIMEYNRMVFLDGSHNKSQADLNYISHYVLLYHIYTILYHIVLYHIISYHIISYHFISNGMI